MRPDAVIEARSGTRRLSRRSAPALALVLGLAACGPAALEPPAGEDARLLAGPAEAVAALPDARVTSVWGGVPRMIEGDLGALAAAATEAGAPAPAEVAAAFWVAPEELVLERVRQDALGHTHLRYRQRLDGRPVVGGDLVLHAGPDGRLHSAGGTARRPASLASEPRVPAEAAAAAVARPGAEVGTPRLVHFSSQWTGRLHLAWEVPVVEPAAQPPRHDLLYLDAVTGARLGGDPQIHTALHREVYDDRHRGSYWSLPGTLRRAEGDRLHGDVSVDAAYAHLGNTWSCMWDLFGRDSLDGEGGTLRATVHFGSNFANAAWTGEGLILGDGDRLETGDMAQTFDVIAHEVGHGVTDYGANLVYELESGALNEAWSDVLAAACEDWSGGSRDDVWIMGEDVDLVGWGLRRMDDPVADGRSRDYYPDRYVIHRAPSQWNDWGGVHSNNGIANLAFQLLAEGGTHPRGKSSVAVPAVGLRTAARIFYRAFDVYLVSGSGFEDARAATVRAARDLEGAPAAEAVKRAWDAVGVPDGQSGTDALRLENGVPVTISEVLASGAAAFYLELPAGASDVRIETAATGGDLDLYVRYALPAEADAWDLTSRGAGPDERLDLFPATPGRWFVRLVAQEAYGDAILTASWTPPSLTAPAEPTLPPPPPTP